MKVRQFKIVFKFCICILGRSLPELFVGIRAGGWGGGGGEEGGGREVSI